MIKLNLMDEAEIARNLQQSGGFSVSSNSASKRPNWFVMGPAIAAVLYLCFLGYYFVAIKGPLSEMVVEVQDCDKKLATLKPKAAETREIQKKLEDIKKVATEFEKFLNSKKNWAKVLNVLSDELPEEVVFEGLAISDGTYSKKVKSDKGLSTANLKCDILKVDISVSAEAQAKVSSYEKKLKTHPWLSSEVAGVESSGLVLVNEKYYSSSITLYFEKLQESSK